MQGYSPNQSPYPQNYSPQGHPQGQYYSNQPYPGPQHQVQQGYPNPPYRGGHGGYRGNHFSGPDRRFPSQSQSYPPAPAQRGRGGHFSNLSWTPATGRRGGHPTIDNKPRGAVAQVGQTITPVTPQGVPEPSGSSVDEEDNPFRPSKDLRVEDETTKEETKMPPPSKPAPVATSPQDGKV